MPPTVRAGDLAMSRAARRSRRGAFVRLSHSPARSDHQCEGETAWSACVLFIPVIEQSSAINLLSRLLPDRYVTGEAGRSA